MLRASLCWMVLLVFVTSALATGGDAKAKKDKKGKKGASATITKVDAKKGTVTVKMKDKSGKQVERTFTLTGEVEMFDDNGKTIRLADIDVFRSGDYVLILERDGKLRELRKDHPKKANAKEKAK